ALQRVFKYQNSFKYTRTKLNWQEAILVKAYPKNDNNTVLVDWFLVKDRHLYRLSFSVSPKDNFPKYKSLFLAMANSFEFI
ncbi:MAG: hypothetical protein NUV91_00880, partial [Candidatus Omnitrophica bacterium]|nr:hypothetical protein [Candidatus Omnitrophota bacterium]